MLWTDGHQTTAAKADKACCLLLVVLPPASTLRRETAHKRLPDRHFRGRRLRGLQQSRAQQREAAPGLLLCAHCGAETEGQRALFGAISTRDRVAAKRPPGSPAKLVLPRAAPLEAASYAADAPFHPG